MTFFFAWVVFPVALVAVCVGCGLFVERIAGIAVSPALVLPLGLAAVVVVAGLATMARSTAQFATPAVVAVAVAGFGLSHALRRRIAGAAVSAAAGAFGVFAAPVILGGGLTVPGWIKLDDTATWLALTDRVMHYGRSVAGLPPSTYELTLSLNLSAGYPVGAFLPLGVGRDLVGRDLVWLFQPYQAFLAGALALGIYALVSDALRSRALRACVAFVGSQAALYYGYALWGGVKEVAAAPLVVLAAALVRPLRAADSGVRAAVPLAVASAALLGALSAGGGVWLVPILVATAVLVWRSRGRRFAILAIALFLGTAAVLSAPTIAISRAFARASAPISAAGELGNLIRPLRFVQVFGIWPVGDFRADPGRLGQTYVLIAVAALAVGFAVAAAIKRDAIEPVLFCASGLFGAAVLTLIGSPWVAAKGLASASPALVTAALLGGAMLVEGGRRVEGLVLLAAIGGGVIWSNALQYHDVNLAPHAQLAELSTIGSRFAGDGPALMMEYSPYGARHFLRGLDPESAGELRSRIIPLRNGQEVPKGGYADIDEVQLGAVLVYRTLVLNRSPAASRPPSIYRLVWRGRFYDVWQRPVTPSQRIIDHLPLGSANDAAAVPSCSTVERLAREAADNGGSLEAVLRPPAVVAPLSHANTTPGWRVDPEEPDVVFPSRSGGAEVTVTVPVSGTYGIWLGGSFRRRLVVYVDGHRIWQGRNELNHPGVYTPTGDARLTAGKHAIVLAYSAGNFWPGSGGAVATYGGLGPLELARQAPELAVTRITPARATSLCGKSLDWIEAVSAATP